jgi:hypothetical protein
MVVVLVSRWQCESRVEFFACLLLLAQSEVGASKFQVMDGASRLKRDCLLEAIDSLLVRRIGKFSVDGLGDRLQDWIEVGNFIVPAAQDMPGVVVSRVGARRGLRLLLDELG